MENVTDSSPKLELRRMKRVHLLSLTIILVSAISVSYRLIFAPSDELVYGSDFFNPCGFFYLAQTSYLRDSILKWKSVPLLNPFIFSGTPYLSDPQTSVYYLTTLILTLAPNEYLATRWAVIIHLVISGVSMYTLMTVWKQRPVASLVGALGFMFSGFFFARVYAGHIAMLYAYAWMPLALAFYSLALEKESDAYPALVGLFLSFQIQSGGAVIFFYSAFLLILYQIFWLVSEVISYKDSNRNESRELLQVFKQVAKTNLVTLCWVLLLASAKILAYLEMAPYLVLFGRIEPLESLALQTIRQWSIPLDQIFPVFEDSSMALNGRHEFAFYLGLLLFSVPLAIVCFPFLEEKRKAAFLLFATTISVLLSSGYHLAIIPVLGPLVENMFRLFFLFFPFLGWLRVQSRFLVVTQLTIPALSTLLISDFLNRPIRYRRLVRMNLQSRRVVAFCVVVVIILNLGLSNMRYMDTVEVTRMNPIIRWMQNHIDIQEPFRIYSLSKYHVQTSLYGYISTGYESTQGHGMAVKSYMEYLSTAESLESMKMLGALNVRYVISSREDTCTGLTLLCTAKYKGENLRLYENQYFTPRVHTVNHAILVISNSTEQWIKTSTNIMNQVGFDPRKCVVILKDTLEDATLAELKQFDAIYLTNIEASRDSILEQYVGRGGMVFSQNEKIPDAIWARINSDKPRGHSILESYGRQELRAQVTSGEKIFVIFSEVHIPGWRVSIDSKGVGVFRANGIFFALILQKGTYQVDIKFIPMSYEVGVTATLVSHIAVLWLVLSNEWIRLKINSKRELLLRYFKRLSVKIAD